MKDITYLKLDEKKKHILTQKITLHQRSEKKLATKVHERDYYLNLPPFLEQYIKRNATQTALQHKIYKTEQIIHEQARIQIENETKEDKKQLLDMRRQIETSRLDINDCIHCAPNGTYSENFFCEFCNIRLRTAN